jgi:hypothetical protein
MGEEMVRGRTAQVDLIVDVKTNGALTGRTSDNAEGRSQKKKLAAALHCVVGYG